MASMLERDARTRERAARIARKVKVVEARRASIKARTERWERAAEREAEHRRAWNRADAAWERATEEWTYGNIEEALLWTRAAAAWAKGHTEAAIAWERAVNDDDEIQTAEAWERAADSRAYSLEVSEDWACVAKAREAHSREDLALAWEHTAHSLATHWSANTPRVVHALESAAKSLRDSESIDAFCLAEALEAWLHAAETQFNNEPKVSEAWACAATAWVASNVDQNEDAKAWECAAKAWARNEFEAAVAWESTATAWARGSAQEALTGERIALAAEARKHSDRAQSMGQARKARAWQSAAEAWSKGDDEAALAREHTAWNLFE